MASKLYDMAIGIHRPSPSSIIREGSIFPNRIDLN